MSSKTTSAPVVFQVLIVAKYYLGVKTFQVINGFMDFGCTNIYIPYIFCHIFLPLQQEQFVNVGNYKMSKRNSELWSVSTPGAA